MIRRWAWLLAIAVLAAGCGATPLTATPLHVQKPTAVGWVRSDLRPVSQPELAGGLLVLYVAAGGGLQVDALNPKTGRTVWHASASPGGTTPGVAPVLGVAGSTVVFLSPVDNATQSAQVVGVDGATGRVLWRTPTGVYTDWPAPCPDDPLDVCTTGFAQGGQETVALRFRASDGGPTGNTLISQSEGGRSVGPNLFDPGTRSPEMLLAVNGASVAWTRDLASVFTAPGLSTDNGWDFVLVPARGLYVGSVAGPPVSSTGSGATIDLARNMTAGFRVSDGTAVWRDPGTTFACGSPLPCPTAASASGENQANPANPAITAGLRLRATGTVSVSVSSTRPTPRPGDDVVVEGFDLATGKTLWSYDAGSDVSLFAQTPPLLAANVVVLPAPGGGMVALNLATGARSPAQAGTVTWCQAPVLFKTQVKYPVGAAGYERISQEMIKPCRASGASVAAPRAVAGFVGTVVDGLTVWGESSEVAAAPTSS